MYPKALADPVGLVMRMLRSGDKAAYSALGLAALQIAAMPLDRLLRSRERRLLAAAEVPGEPIVLIVGLPRSGTTLVYQVMASALACSFFDNLSALFPNSTISATRRFRRSFAFKSSSFQSFYGKTVGLSGPNDAFHVWNRWFGGDHYMPRAAPDGADGMRRFFAAWMAQFPGPLVNKNNRNSLCMVELASMLPTAFFIVVERDPVYVAQSLYQARLRIHGDASIGWGLGAQDGSDRASRDASQSVADQVIHMDRAMRSALASLPPSRFLRMSYEEFCRNPRRQIDRVVDAVLTGAGGVIERNPSVYASLPDSFPCRNAVSLDDGVFSDLRRRLSA